jgi:hypothetical protein
VILKIDRLAVELPMPTEPDPDAAAAVQELMGGRFGEMSTLMNYTFQSFNFRGRERAKPYYDLISNISAEEYGHIELVAATINGMLTGASDASQVDGQVGLSLPGAKDKRLSHHFIVSGQGALAANLARPAVAGRLHLQLRRPRSGPAAQLLPGVRRAGPEDPRLRDDRSPDRATDARLPARPRRRPPGGPTPRPWRS